MIAKSGTLVLIDKNAIEPYSRNINWVEHCFRHWPSCPIFVCPTYDIYFTKSELYPDYNVHRHRRIQMAWRHVHVQTCGMCLFSYSDFNVRVPLCARLHDLFYYISKMPLSSSATRRQHDRA